MQTKTGTWEGNGPEYEGFTALVAITLYECEVPFTDPALRKAVEAVRSSATRSNSVYAISLAIILLDLLQDDVDEPLIESLSLRLVTSQTNLGGWGYKTGAVPEAEWKRLEAHYEKAKGQRHKESKPGRTLQDLSPEIQKQLAQFATSGTQIDDTKITSDNSNTQFATLALWVSRRHGFPVDTALALIDLRYRKSRNLDGGWGYWPTADREIKQGVTKPATTCSALLGLSVGHGVMLATRKGLGPDARMLPDPSRDLDLRAGLTYLATKIGDPPSLRKTPVPQLGRTDYYFLWSLERVLLALDMQTLGGKDWYAWGTELLLANQQADGHWIGEHASGADTCFALLFLRRANLAADLTAQMKKSSVVLTAGGAREKEPKPPAETGTKKPPSESTPTKEPPKTTVPKPEPRPTFSKPESARLAEELVKATSARQGELLGEWRQAKGVHYTEALAGAIPQLTGDSKRQARDPRYPPDGDDGRHDSPVSER